jgi:hypothetical protein
MPGLFGKVFLEGWGYLIVLEYYILLTLTNLFNSSFTLLKRLMYRPVGGDIQSKYTELKFRERFHYDKER